MRLFRAPAFVKSSQFRWVTYGVLLAAAVNLFLGWARTWNDSPSIASQLESIRAAAEDEGLEPIVDRAVDLKATGEPTRLFVFHDRWPLGKPWRDKHPRSDVIKLYNDSGGRLNLALEFRPDRLAGSDPVYFKLVAVRDVDGNGRPEILGAFYPWAADSLESSPVPVVIAWDDALQKFRFFPLFSQPPHIESLSHPGPYGRGQRRLYDRAVTFTDGETGLRVRGFPVSAFAIARSSHGKPAILESFVVKSSCHFCIQEIEVQMMTARYQAPPETFPCMPLTRPRNRPGILVHVPSREWLYARPSEFLEQNSTRFGRRFECFS